MGLFSELLKMLHLTAVALAIPARILDFCSWFDLIHIFCTSRMFTNKHKWIYITPDVYI